MNDAGASLAAHHLDKLTNNVSYKSQDTLGEEKSISSASPQWRKFYLDKQRGEKLN